MVELADIIFALSIKILIGNTLAQLLKIISKEMMIGPNFHWFIVVRKLYCLIKLMHSKVLALIS